MLIYSTRFRVIPAFDKKCFVDRIIEWNKKGSNPIEDIETDSFSFIAGDDNNFLEVTDLEEENVIAARIHIDNRRYVEHRCCVQLCRKRHFRICEQNRQRGYTQPFGLCLCSAHRNADHRQRLCRQEYGYPYQQQGYLHSRQRNCSQCNILF